jgi:hypothetical protein
MYTGGSFAISGRLHIAAYASRATAMLPYDFPFSYIPALQPGWSVHFIFTVRDIYEFSQPFHAPHRHPVFSIVRIDGMRRQKSQRIGTRPSHAAS